MAASVEWLQRRPLGVSDSLYTMAAIRVGDNLKALSFIWCQLAVVVCVRVCVCVWVCVCVCVWAHTHARARTCIPHTESKLAYSNIDYIKAFLGPFLSFMSSTNQLLTMLGHSASTEICEPTNDNWFIIIFLLQAQICPFCLSRERCMYPDRMPLCQVLFIVCWLKYTGWFAKGNAAL